MSDARMYHIGIIIFIEFYGMFQSSKTFAYVFTKSEQMTQRK